MKKLIILVLMILNTVVNAQKKFPVNENGKYEINEIISIEGNQKDIYNACFISITEMFKDIDKVLQYKNEEEGILIIKFTVSTQHRGMGPRNHYFKFNLKIEFKDNKYRIILNYLNHESFLTSANGSCKCTNEITNESCGISPFVGGVTNKEWDTQTINANKEVLNTVENLKSLIEKNIKSLPSKSSDW